MSVVVSSTRIEESNLPSDKTLNPVSLNGFRV